MKILVPVKRVIDYQQRVRLNKDRTDVEKNNVKMSMNPFDEIALEAAIQLKEKGIASEICAVSIGPLEAQETLRHALAMGADKALLIVTSSDIEPLLVAQVLQKIVLQQNSSLVLSGKQAIDNDCNQVPQMLAGLLSWSQATFASHIDYQNDRFMVTREIDGGLETLSLSKPAVISADLRLNKPRFVSLPNIMKARAKPIETIQLDALALHNHPQLTTLEIEEPMRKRSCIKLNHFNELMTTLNEAGLL